MLMHKIVVLENLRSLHNVGSVFRVADGAGWDQVILGGYTGCPPDRRIEKVSLGAEEFVAWEKAENIVEKVQQLKSEGYRILALEQTSMSVDLFNFVNKNKKVVLILGNEVEGVSPELLALAEDHLEIPMHGQKGSLNVSIAAGIALYALKN